MKAPTQRALLVVLREALALLLTGAAMASGALAQGSSAPSPSPATQAPAAPKETPPAATPAPSNPDTAAPSAGWTSGIKLSLQAEAGIAFNPQRPDDNLNFGQLFTDKANQFQLNQMLLTTQKPISPKDTGFAAGFKIQLLYGSDARYTHFLGELDRTIAGRYQLDVVEADVALHLPILTEGGVDVKAGQYPSPLGSETIDPSSNPFYSHSYIFNFGVPFKHTGVLTTTHASSILDLYLGIDSGANTSLGAGNNNGAPGGIAGAGLSLLGGKLTVLALTHIGPENPARSVPNADSYNRYYNDVVVTYKPDNTWAFTTEGNYVRDEYTRAEGYGVAQYVSYALSSQVTLNGRAEVWRDNRNFYVTAAPGNLDYVDSERGFPAAVISAPRPTTYSEITVGLTYKPPLPAPVSTLMIRPELRYDRALDGSHPFAAGHDNGAFTAAADLVLGF